MVREMLRKCITEAMGDGKAKGVCVRLVVRVAAIVLAVFALLYQTFTIVCYSTRAIRSGPISCMR